MPMTQRPHLPATKFWWSWKMPSTMCRRSQPGPDRREPDDPAIGRINEQLVEAERSALEGA